MSGPLEGIRVLDLSRILAGPYGTQMLGDFGAEIIKVERPGKGDDTRHFGPPFKDGESAYFLSVNRNKKSITVDMKKKEGIEVVRRILEKSDVLIENFRPGALARLGLDYESLKDDHPGLIYVSISGFGHTGPFSSRPGYDLAIQGMGGIMSITGPENGMPCKVGTSIADILSGIYAVIGTLLALQARNRTGKGQKVDVSMLDGQVSLLTYQAGIYFMTGESPRRRGNQHPTICPYETFQTSDGYINLAVGNDKLWVEFCQILGMPELASDERFRTNPDRVRARDELFPIIQEKMLSKTTGQWLEILDGKGVPAGPIYSVGEVLEHPQVKAREMVVELEHPVAGQVKATGVPIKLSGTPGGVSSPPPTLGQHTEVVLRDIGFSSDEIKNLKSIAAI